MSLLFGLKPRSVVCKPIGKAETSFVYRIAATDRDASVLDALDFEIDAVPDVRPEAAARGQ
jgi:hypothetical protein